MSAAKLSAGWSVEMLGLIGAVKFSHRGGRSLMWCDGDWTMGVGRTWRDAPGVPQARNMSEARTVGAAFIARAEGES